MSNGALMLLDTTRRLTWIALGCLAGCDSSPTMNAIPRSGIRSDAVGCWAFTTAVQNARAVQLTQLPILARLDTSSTLAEVPGRRAVQRLAGNGEVLLHDAEGLPFLDVWMADSLSDKIRISFSDGFYGSTWVLELPTGRSSADTMRGRSKEFDTDDIAAPTHPVREALATRIECLAADM